MSNTRTPPTPRVPCGHNEDAVLLQSSGSWVAYCARCEHAYQLVQNVPVLDAYASQLAFGALTY